MQSSGARAFQRVHAEEWLGKKGAASNKYEDTFGAEGWGFRAQQVLGAVRGKCVAWVEVLSFCPVFSGRNLKLPKNP
jgi:hypothetical protein